MKLGELVSALKSLCPVARTSWTEKWPTLLMTPGSVKPGSLFVAVRGFHSDGHRFIPQAVQQGAVAVVAEFEDRAAAGPQACRRSSSRIRGRRSRFWRTSFYGHPSRLLKLVGITGTKGKTTTSYLVRSILEAAGHASGLDRHDRLPGRGQGLCRAEHHARIAGPSEAPAGDGGRRHRRTASWKFHPMPLPSAGRITVCSRAAVFTNLAQDHLDFHKDQESYFQAKLLLFTGLGAGARPPSSMPMIRGAGRSFGATRRGC